MRKADGSYENIHEFDARHEQASGPVDPPVIDGTMLRFADGACRENHPFGRLIEPTEAELPDYHDRRPPEVHAAEKKLAYWKVRYGKTEMEFLRTAKNLAEYCRGNLNQTVGNCGPAPDENALAELRRLERIKKRHGRMLKEAQAVYSRLTGEDIQPSLGPTNEERDRQRNQAVLSEVAAMVRDNGDQPEEKTVPLAPGVSTKYRPVKVSK